MTCDEMWVDVLGWEGIYQISDQGRLKSFNGVNGLCRKTAGGYVWRFAEEVI